MTVTMKWLYKLVCY